MQFEKDLFISYAHIDNQPLSPEQEGWVSRFHATLEALLSMRLGRKTTIWRDEKLSGNDVFADEIVKQFSHAAVLVSVLTPRYVNSEWCTREVSEFCRSAEQTGGVVVENKARVFKVLKAPVDSQESLPTVVKDILGYEFFTYEDEVPLELDAAYGEKYAQDYNRKVGKLAWEISQLLQKLATDPGGSDPDEPATSKATVYLAECSRDHKETREILEGDLKRHGYPVLPDNRLPNDEEEEYVAAVKHDLSRSQLSIHLVGASYGAVPEGPSQSSVVVLQNALAAEQSRQRGLPRVIWLPEGTGSAQAKQQAFIDALHRDADTQYGADLITGDIEDLKNSVHSLLQKLEQQKSTSQAHSTAADGPRLIYLICSERDRKATVPVRKFFKQQGFEIAIPAFEGDATAIRTAHQQLMIHCDAIIVFYGAGDEAWKRTIDTELKKMPGYRGEQPLLARFTYLADPKTSDKEDLIEMEEPNLIKGFGDFSEAPMAAFLRAVNSHGGTA